MADIEKYRSKELTKFLNNDKIKEIYPMIDHIDVYYYGDLSSVILRIFVNDPELTYENMYKKGLDPHYLVDHHLAKILPYFSYPSNTKFGFVILSPSGEHIHDYMD